MPAPCFLQKAILNAAIVRVRCDLMVAVRTDRTEGSAQAIGLIGSSGPAGGTTLSARVARASCRPSHIPSVPELDLKGPSKGRSGPERSEATRRGLIAAVCALHSAWPCCQRDRAGPSGYAFRGSILPGPLGPEGVCWCRRAYRVQQTLVCA